MAFRSFGRFAPSGCILRRLHHLIALQTLRADSQALYFTLHARAHGLQVRKPAPARLVMRVAHVVATNWFLSADVTDFCHVSSSFFDFESTLLENNIEKSVQPCNGASRD